VFGSLQALEALKYLLGLPGLAANEMLIFDLITLSTQRLRAKRAADCAAHSRARDPEAHAHSGTPAETAPPASLELRFGSLADALAAGYALVDVRDSHERIAEPMPNSLHLPMSKLLAQAPSLDSGGRYLLVCATGRRSGAAADLLRSQGYLECRSLRGGLKGLKTPA
jgi:adenylyltransferase/sulfurtransferase